MIKTEKFKEILKAIKEFKQEPKAEDFNISFEDFAETIEHLDNERYIRGAAFSRAGRKILIVFLNTAKITEKGIKFLE